MNAIKVTEFYTHISNLYGENILSKFKEELINYSEDTPNNLYYSFYNKDILTAVLNTVLEDEI